MNSEIWHKNLFIFFFIINKYQLKMLKILKNKRKAFLYFIEKYPRFISKIRFVLNLMHILNQFKIIFELFLNQFTGDIYLLLILLKY